MNNLNNVCGIYNPINKAKTSKEKIYFKSLIEKKFCMLCDYYEFITEWEYEPIEIEYFSILDKQTHNYIPDFYVNIEINNFSQKYIIEIKPENKLYEPKYTNKKNTIKSLRAFNEDLREYIVNNIKFSAAIDYCKQHDMKFKIITDTFLTKINIRDNMNNYLIFEN